MSLPNKLVAVLNKNLDPGKAMNALSHISLALGAQLGPNQCELIDYTTEDKVSFPGISKMPFIVAKGTEGKIRKLVEAAKAHDINWALFTETMTIGSWDEQVARTAKLPNEQIPYFGIVLFGPRDLVTELTKKFSLWR